MESKKVEIVLGADGSVKVEAFGFKGASCEEATAFLDELFGKRDSVNYKDDYYTTDETLIADGLPSGYCG